MRSILNKLRSVIRQNQKEQRDKEISSTYDVTFNNGNIFIMAGSIPVMKLDSAIKVSEVVKQIELMQEAARSFKCD